MENDESAIIKISGHYYTKKTRILVLTSKNDNGEEIDAIQVLSSKTAKKVLSSGVFELNQIETYVLNTFISEREVVEKKEAKDTYRPPTRKKKKKEKRKSKNRINPTAKIIKYLSPEDIDPVITGIAFPEEDYKTKTLQMRLVFSSNGERKVSKPFSDFDSIIDYVKQTNFKGTENALEILERHRNKWVFVTSQSTLPNTQGIKPEPGPKNYTIPPTDDMNPEFTDQYLKYEKYPLPEKVTDIYLGLDFGTSFTKIAFHMDNNNKGILHFGNTVFKPTVVYFNENSKLLSFFKPKDGTGFQQIRFFKATMVKEQQEYDAIRYKNLDVSEDFEFLCSVFFLSNIIRYCKNKLGLYFKCTPDLYITMGIPMFKNKTDEVLYNKALHAAVYISGQKKEIWNMSISELGNMTATALKDFDNDFYDFKKEGFQNGTMPELFAESLYLLNRRDYGSGYYYIVDIGGGTADFAFIHKEKAFGGNKFWYYCPSRAVEPLGNEVRKAACVDKELEKAYHDKFYKAYMPTITKGRNALEIQQPFKITRLMFGGGAVDPEKPYQKKEPYYRSGLAGINCKVVNRDDDSFVNIVPRTSDLTPEDRQRLVIAVQLSNPNSRGSYLSGNPWDYDTDPKPPKKPTPPDGPGYDDIG